MTRDEREQALWHDAYMLAMSQEADPIDASGLADAAVAAFRERYPQRATSASDIDKDACAKGWILFLTMAGVGLVVFLAIALAMAWI